MTGPEESRSGQDRHIWERFRFHSRTFSLAALFFPRGIRMPVAILYLFCRTVDEVADQMVLDDGPAAALSRLDQIQTELDHTLSGRPPDQLLWTRLAEVHSVFTLQRGPMDELIDGARWDLSGRSVESEEDLVHYSNLVGGSIGAMMLPLLGLSADTRVQQQARDLGIGMQITNILRDVGEDLHTLNRSYLPTSMLETFGVDPSSPDTRTTSYRLMMESLMSMAEGYFESGMNGIEALPFGMRPGIRAASRFYREILNEVRANDYDNVSRRAYVPNRRKLLALVPGGYERRKQKLV